MNLGHALQGDRSETTREGGERTLGYDDHDDAGGGKTAIILIGLRSAPRRTYTILGERGFRENVFPRRALQLRSPLALKGFRGKHVTVRCTENYHPRTR